MKHGKGVYIYANKCRFEGLFEYDMRQGKGDLTCPNGRKYKGQYRKGHRIQKGEGIEIYEDESRYIGQFKDAMRDGKGTLTFKNGCSYRGG